MRGRKLKISLVFITQSYFAVVKNISLNSTHYFITKLPNKRDLQQIVYCNDFLLYRNHQILNLKSL